MIGKRKDKKRKGQKDKLSFLYEGGFGFFGIGTYVRVAPLGGHYASYRAGYNTLCDVLYGKITSRKTTI